MKFSIRKCKNATNICLWYSKWPHVTHKRNPKKNKWIKVKRLRYLQISVKNHLFWPTCHILEASEFLFHKRFNFCELNTPFGASSRHTHKVTSRTVYFSNTQNKNDHLHNKTLSTHTLEIGEWKNQIQFKPVSDLPQNSDTLPLSSLLFMLSSAAVFTQIHTILLAIIQRHQYSRLLTIGPGFGWSKDFETILAMLLLDFAMNTPSRLDHLFAYLQVQV